MSAFAVDPVFTPLQWIAFSGFLLTAVLIQFAFSPKRRAIMGRAKFALASAVVATPGIAGVTLVRGAYRAGYLEEGRGFLEANLRSIVWMSGFIFLSQLAVRFAPPMSWLSRDLAHAGKAVWSARLNRWMGRA
ncbi:hypothetical protein [Brevundimonas subvibrioides]|uniref:Uncharacterized protein n=1 Tax=Brevundimonas subvibrioides (strain ATCC 15264 / DSM 4735 / LMG 14903 / NBRC 16000 / CB 81) TaxID=633149 RepID=D9QHZ1_BRESC|nr:hypothetical protein [Brevundimonas subvibrioides]ADL01249.1 hypothetical protein Bresu_1938 [Brevundimonas subvibrioides ATCC 15264]